MKRFICCCIVLAGIFLGTAWAEEGLIKLTDRIYTYAGTKNPSPANSFGANAGIVIGDKGVLVVDSLVSGKEAKRLLADIRKITDKPIRYVVDTHNHFDHTFGNSEFATLGAVIVAHDNCSENMRVSSKQVLDNAESYGLNADEAKEIKIAYPNVSTANGMHIGLGGISVDLIYVAPSHTDDSIMIFIPEEKVVFAGDVLFTDYYPFMGTGTIEGWVKTLEKLNEMDADRIIPGHGPLSTKKDVAAMKEFILAFDKAAKEICAKPGDPAEMAEKVKKAVPERPLADFLIMASLQAKYLKAGN